MKLHSKWQSNSAELLPDIKKIIDFLLIENWRERVDMVVGLTVDPASALEREFKDQLTQKPGSIMNSETLKEYNDTFNDTFESEGQAFRNIIKIDTTKMNTLEGVTKIVEKVLEAADQLLDDEVAVVNKNIVSPRFTTSGYIAEKTSLNGFMEVASREMTWMKRSKAEENAGVVQILPVLVMKYGDQTLYVTIRGGGHGSMDRKSAVWLGGHVRRSTDDIDEDKNGKGKSSKLNKILRRTVEREVKEELNDFPIHFNQISKQPVIAVWDTTNSRSSQHLAVFYEMTIPTSEGRARLHLREMVETPTKTVFTQFITDQDTEENRVIDGLEELESWSKVYLREIKGFKHIQLSKGENKLF